MVDGLTADTRGLNDLAKDVRLVAVRLESEVSAELVASANSVADLARKIAVGHSQKVADSIHVRPAGKKTARVEAGAGVPIAGIWELGNRGSDPRSPTFVHPVYGVAGTSVVQAKHPYLSRAFDESEPAVIERFVRMAGHLLDESRL